MGYALHSDERVSEARGSMSIAARVLWVELLLLCAVGCSEAKPLSAEEEANLAQSRLVGQPAPPFELTDNKGRLVRSGSFEGQWVVLYFYPRNDLPGCVCDASEYTDLLMHFHDLGALVFGIDDLSPRSHHTLSKKYHVSMSLLSDADRATTKSYGAWGPPPADDPSAEQTVRSTFLIDPQGVVRAHWRNVTAKGHVEQVRQRLQLLQKSS